MDLTKQIFNRYAPNLNKLETYGFRFVNNKYIYEKNIKNDTFKIIVQIDKNLKISSYVYDLKNNELFLPITIEDNQGEFVTKIREAYEQTLINIRNNCFNKQYFIYPQANRITQYLIDKYLTKPEFL